MQEESKLAYQFALQVATQLITLSTAIIGVMVTFTRDLFKNKPVRYARYLLMASWLAYLASIWYGVGHIQALAGSLERAAIEQLAIKEGATGAEARAAELPLSGLASTYLATTDTGVRRRSRERLAATGVMVGLSAKLEAMWQIRLFLLGTVLAVAYGITMLRSEAAPKAGFTPE